MYIVPGQRQTTPWGQMLMSTESPYHCPFVESFKTISTHFFMFFHMYIAPSRGRQQIGDKILMTTERPFLFTHILQVSK